MFCLQGSQLFCRDGDDVCQDTAPIFQEQDAQQIDERQHGMVQQLAAPPTQLYESACLKLYDSAKHLVNTLNLYGVSSF